MGCSFEKKTSITIINLLAKVLDKSCRKPNKTWEGKRSKFCNRLMMSWLQNNGIEIYFRHKEGKSVVAKRFIRILKNKIYYYMTAILKYACIGKLHNIV